MHASLTRPIHALLGLAGLRCRRVSGLRDAVRPPGLREIHLGAGRLFPDRDHILPLVPAGSRVVEVGVGFGDFTRKILDVVKPREFVALDLFDLRRPHTFGGASHEAFYRQRFQREIDDGIVQIRRGPSHVLLNALPDDRFDLVYLDASHVYARVKQDVEAAQGKVRPGGLLAMDDYERSDPIGFLVYGVRQAAHELCLSRGWTVVCLTLENAESASNVVLQRPPA